MASSCRVATAALLNVTSHKVVSTSFIHSAALPSAVLSTEPLEPPNIPDIFDIFDAPVKLRERNTSDKPSKRYNTDSATCATSRIGPSHSKNTYNDTFGLPRSLPPPVTFDGPACPLHMSPLTLEKCREQRRILTCSPRRDHGSSAAPCSAFTSQPEPLYKLFDGPSRITRYQYPTSQNEWYSPIYVSLVLCLSSALGWLALDLQRNDNVRSP